MIDAEALLSSCTRPLVIGIGGGGDVVGARATAEVQVREPTYGAKEGRLWLIEQAREGQVAQPLTNFDARIVREIIVDDGVESKVLFEISGKTDEGVVLPPVDVTADEFAKGSWPIAKWGAAAITTPMVRAEREPSVRASWR